MSPLEDYERTTCLRYRPIVRDFRNNLHTTLQLFHILRPMYFGDKDSTKMGCLAGVGEHTYVPTTLGYWYAGENLIWLYQQWTWSRTLKVQMYESAVQLRPGRGGARGARGGPQSKLHAARGARGGGDVVSSAFELGNCFMYLSGAPRTGQLH